MNILDSTGADPYLGDVLVKGQRIVSVGTKLLSDDLVGARIIKGNGRTLMSGLGTFLTVRLNSHNDDHSAPCSGRAYALHLGFLRPWS